MPRASRPERLARPRRASSHGTPARAMTSLTGRPLMTKVALTLSVAAVGLSAFAVYETRRGAAQEQRERLERLEARTDELAVLATRLENLEAKVGAGAMAP